MNKVTCSNCGAEVDEWDAKAIGTGRRRQWLCLTCYRSGRQDADARAYIKAVHAVDARAKRGERNG